MNIGELFIRIRPDTEGFEKQIERTVSQSMAAVGASLTSTGRQLTRSVTLPVVGFGAAIVKTAADFETGMLKVQAVSDATGEEFQKLRDQAIELGSETMFSASEAAEAMGYLAMAGFDVNQVYGSMPSVLQLAASAQIDLGSAADIASNIVAGFGLDVKELAFANDVLVAAMNRTNTDLVPLGEAFKYVGPVAKSAGVSFTETAAAIGLLSNAGIQGTMAGTTLRGAIAALLSPTDAAAGIMREAGFSALDASGNLLPLVDIIRSLEQSSMTTGQMMEVFGQRAGPGMMALVEQGSGALEKLNQELNNSGGIAQRVAEIQMSGFKGAWDELTSSFEGFMIALADAGFLKLIQEKVESITNFITKITELNPELLKMAMTFLAVAAAIGPTLWIIGKLITTIAKLIQIASILKAVFLLMAANPITLIIAGIVALVAAIVIAYQKFEGFRNVIDAIGRFLRDVFVAAWNAVVDVFFIVIDVIKQVAAIIWDVLVAAWETAVDAIGVAIEVLADVFSTMGDFIGDAIGVVTDVFGEVVEVVSSAMDAVEEPISSFIDWVKNNFGPPIAAAVELVVAIWDQLSGRIQLAINVIKTVVSVLGSIFSVAFDAVKTVVSAGLNFVITVFQPPFDFIVGIAKTYLGLLVDGFKFYFDVIVTVVKVAFDLITSAFDIAFAIIKPIVQVALDAIKVVWEVAFNAVKNTVTVVFNGIKGAIEMVLQIITGIFTTFTGLVTGNFSKTFEGLKMIVLAPFNFIKDQVGVIVGALVSTVKTLFDGLITFFKNIPSRIGSALSGIKDAMMGAFRAAINGIKSLWNNTLGRLSFTIPDWVPFVGGKSFSFPKFPEFADGGIINSPTLGWIGEAGPEAIIPLNRPDRALDIMRQTGLDALAANRSMGSAVNIQNAVFNNGTDANLVAQKVNAAERARSIGS